MPVLSSPLDMQTVIRTVGSASGARGLAYFEKGAVSGLEIHGDGDDMWLTAQVKGTAPRPYDVEVYLDSAPGGRGISASGDCTCPMAVNCKHVAAVMFAAGRTGRVLVADQGAEPGARPTGRGPSSVAAPAAVTPLWERILTPVATTSARAAEPVALLIEHAKRTSGPPSLRMRPVLHGKRDKWIVSGISWPELDYPRRQLPERALGLLREIATLQRTGNSYYFSDRSGIDLAGFPSPRLWDVLADAAAADLPLIGDFDGTPVVLEPDAVTAEIDIAADTAGADAAGPAWSLTADLMLRGTPIGAPVSWIGIRPHGIAYRVEPTPTAADPSPAAVLHLARLSAPLDPAVREILSVGKPVPVPAADRARFVREYLPRLRRHADVVSRGGAVEIPGEAEVRLRLDVARDEVGMVTVAWNWRYIWGSEAIDIPLGLTAPTDLRDIDTEKRLAAVGLDAARPIPALVRRGFAGDELAPRAILSRAQALRFASEVLPALAAQGGVILDVSAGALDFREATSAPVIAMAGSLTPEKDWLDLAVTVTVDGEEVPFADLFRALAAGEARLILPSGTYFPLDTPEFDRLKELIEESYALADRDALDPDAIRLGRYEATYWDELEAMGVLDKQALAWSATVRKLARLTEIPQYDPPAGLVAELRPYQRDGYRWLAFLQQYGLGGILADDMGLGKTIQTLAMVARARAENPDAAPFLVVAPTSVVPNWADEAARFVPGLRVATVTATLARRGTELVEECAGADLVVTSYALFRLEYAAYEAIAWSGLLLDEAQQIKNHLSKGYRCARKLPAPFKLAITGTPMENNLMELWALASIVAPGLLGEPKRFTEHYRGPIEKNQDADRLATLRRRIRPVLLRRTKAEVVKDLPPKTEQVLELDLLPAHRRAYQRFLQRERRKVLGLLGDLDRNRFQIFRSLTLLRQAALDASLVGDGIEGGDTGAAGGPADAAGVTAAEVPSTKLEALVDLVESAAAEGHRVLVFSQFTRFLGRARAALARAGIATCYLDGATTKRAAVLREFREGTAPAFLISLKAGGVGLNLTEADYCIITDPWWNPATEQQAVDRTHRIGQDKPVMVYRLVAADTIEEKVMALKERKAALFASIMTDGGVGSGGLTADDIRSLLA